MHGHSAHIFVQRGISYSSNTFLAFSWKALARIDNDNECRDGAAPASDGTLQPAGPAFLPHRPLNARPVPAASTAGSVTAELAMLCRCL